MSPALCTSAASSSLALAVLMGVTSCGGEGDEPWTPGGGTGGSSSSSGTGGSSSSSGTGGSSSQSCDDPESHEGEATYYDFADGTGNCSFDASPNDMMIGAMNHADYADSAACGACVELTGPTGTITIRIVDRCPECPAGDIDLSPESFAEIAELSAGRVPITWHYTDCSLSGPIVYHFKEGSNEWWSAVQIRNHRRAIASLEYRDSDGNYVAVAREDYNYFVEPAGMGPGPHSFRVTDVTEAQLEDEGIPFVEAGDSPGAGQFPECVPGG